MEELPVEPFQSQVKDEESGKRVEVWDNLSLRATGSDNTNLEMKSPRKEFVERKVDSPTFIEDIMEDKDACSRTGVWL